MTIREAGRLSSFKSKSGVPITAQDLSLIEDPDFKKWVQVYAKDEKKFFADFAKAYQKLTELGCNNLEGGKGWF
jgi:cytochrome c peroxidase